MRASCVNTISAAATSDSGIWTPQSRRALQGIADFAGIVAVQPGQVDEVLAVIAAYEPVRRPEWDSLGP